MLLLLLLLSLRPSRLLVGRGRARSVQAALHGGRGRAPVPPAPPPAFPTEKERESSSPKAGRASLVWPPPLSSVSAIETNEGLASKALPAERGGDKVIAIAAHTQLGRRVRRRRVRGRGRWNRVHSDLGWKVNRRQVKREIFAEVNFAMRRGRRSDST